MYVFKYMKKYKDLTKGVLVLRAIKVCLDYPTRAYPG